MDEDRTHKVSVELEDNTGIIDLFVAITGTTPFQEATSDGDSCLNVASDTIPSKLTDDDIHDYVCRNVFRF